MNNLKNIKFEYEYGLLTAENIEVDCLKQNVDIWINVEDKNKTVSKKQFDVLKDFFNFKQSEIQKINNQLTLYSQELLSENYISKYSNLYELNYTTIIIPRQKETNEKYLFLMAETTWEIKESDFNVELEIMIKNNHFEFLQENTGLWTRLEWDECYNKRKGG